MARVALGRPDGLAQFGASSQSFLASLAPLLAFPLVGTGLLLLRGRGLVALTDLLATLAVLLAPAVISFELSRLWRREEYWLHFATAFNWCQWLLPALTAVLLLVFGMLVQAGLSEYAATGLLMLGLGGYGLWLHWFLARHALHLSRLRAALLVVLVNVGTGLLLLAPRLLSLQRT